MNNFNHFYAGASTPEGFVNCFKDTIMPDKKGFTFILKGGPGTGKSSLMKQIASTFLKNNFKIECYHCSLDPSSLDAVSLVDYGIVIVDGTSPHPKDVEVLGITEKIINLGEFLDNDIMRFEKEINELNLEKTREMKLSSDYFLASSGYYLANKQMLVENQMDLSASLNEMFRSIPLGVKDNHNCVGYERRLFNRTIIDKVGIFEQNNQKLNVVEFVGTEFSLPILMAKLVEKLKDCNINIISFLNPLLPCEIESVYIPEAETLIKGKLQIFEDNKVAFNRQMQNSSIQDGKLHLEKAREIHSKIEKFYIECMDFNALNVAISKLENDIGEVITKRQELVFN